MDGNQFDNLIRAFAAGRSRRSLAAVIAGLGAGSLLDSLLSPASVGAAKKGKGKGKGHGKGKGKGKNKKKKAAPTCTDRQKNGAETDVDCGGGKCPRCSGGKTCISRNDCHTALCIAGACQSCALAGDCGFENDGVTPCFCRDNAEKPGERMCTRQLCDFKGVGSTCAACAPGLQCAPAGGGVECCVPCGG